MVCIFQEACGRGFGFECWLGQIHSRMAYAKILRVYKISVNM